MIVLDRVSARRSPLALSALSLSLGAGAHALVGAPEDGGPLALAVMAGREAPRTGAVTIDGVPASDPRARPTVAYVPREVRLPEVLRVDEILRSASALRGEPPSDPSARLSALGLAELVRRPARTLAPEEARAVALVEALTSTRVKVVLLEEPLAFVDPRALGQIPGAIAARARGGACVVVATASPRDAAELADDHVTLVRGAVVRRGDSADPIAAMSGEGVRLRLLVSEPRALLSALAQERAIAGLETIGRTLVLRGYDARDLAAAVGRAVVSSGVSVIDLRPDAPSLDEVRGAAVGAANAAYHAAYQKTRAALAPEAAAGPGEPTRTREES